MRLSYKIFIDTGGTFTDCIGHTPGGELTYRKVLSNGTLRGEILECLSGNELIVRESWGVERDFIKGFTLSLIDANTFNARIYAYDPENSRLTLDKDLPSDLRDEKLTFEISNGEEAPVLGIRLITNTPPGKPFPEIDVRLGTTKGTNALLEKRGAETALLITRGFKDLLVIGNQQRPDIFSRQIEKETPLASGIYEINERIDSRGNVLESLETEAFEKVLSEIRDKGYKSLAISLLNAYRNPVHEEYIAKRAAESGFAHVSVSSGLSSLIKLLDRTETTVVNAYLSPIIKNYLDDISTQVGAMNLRIMTSAGGLVRASFFQPKDSLLSGPAGGVVGAASVGAQIGEHNLITFDMGGTSTDVSRYDGEFDYSYELQVGSAHIMSPALTIETVAAGGGSVCGFDGYRLYVGPESAGASPGPACYGAGGPLTITDINLLAGKMHPDNFSIPICPEAAERELKKLVKRIEINSGERPSKEELLQSFLRIANEIMAGAIKKISVLKGYDPVAYSMVSFGGAGGLHACSIGTLLGMKKIILPKEAGLLSAYGIGKARIERFAEKLVLLPFESYTKALKSEMKMLIEEAIKKLLHEGIAKENICIRNQKVFLRYKGQDSSIEVNYVEDADLEADFKEKYLSLYNHIADKPIEIEAIRVVASDIAPPDEWFQAPGTVSMAEPYTRTGSGVPVFKAEGLNPGQEIEGPALLLDNFSTTFIEKGWVYMMHGSRTGILKKREESMEGVQARIPFEAELELFTNRFMSIAENMGAMLQRTAFSVNIKERLDFSCALLDASGNLVANAPHIPVHLGGLGVCLKQLIGKVRFKPGDTFVTNHPAFGGSHLPDVTTVSPVFDDDQVLIGFVANRAHHSEIGGISPGSMPPSASTLVEEGVVIAPFLLVEKGKANWEGMRTILSEALYPTRNPEENLADLNAAIAANKNGSDALIKLVREFGTNHVRCFFDALRKHAAERMKDTLVKMPDGEYAANEFLDDGNQLVVKIDKFGAKCRIDFTGSAPVHPFNMNATSAIVISVVIYVLRLLLDEPIPLNDGLLEPVELIIPMGLLNPDFPEDPKRCPAVVGGNVEISQRITDTLLKAFENMAASQGTMNNVLFGNNSFGYYETLAGGTGAGEGFNGSDAVHHHMTNTRITDPEVIEHRYPVRILEASVRKNSGGAGKWEGGNGMTRIYEFMEDVNLSLLTQRRNSGPYGMQGGSAGEKGFQYIIRKDGSRIDLRSVDNVDLQAGDKLVINTPGGGGYGKSD